MRKYWIGFILFLIVISVIGCKVQPNDRVYLDSGWYFRPDLERAGSRMGFFAPEYDITKWEPVEIPHYFSNDYDGMGWYATDFSIPERFTDKRIALVFEGVDDRATVFIDGKKMKKQWLANMPFYLLTDKLKNRASHRLVLEVEDTGNAGGLTGVVYLQVFGNEENLLKSEFHDSTALSPPQWTENGTIYELYVRAFTRRGDFRSVIPHLTEIKELGVSCIWLMPIFPVGEEKRKGSLGSPYSIADYRKVNPEFGTKEDFQALVDAIHGQEMKVILDIACNHTAWDNPLIYEHPEWYTKNSGGKIVSPNADWTDVADLDYSNAELREYMWNTLEYWVREHDVDGYRLDVAELVPMDFWEEAYKRLRGIKPDVLMLAEGADPELHLRGFHVTYAWNTYWTFYQIFRNNVPANTLNDVMELERRRFPAGSTRLRFTENHDQERSTAFFGTRGAKVADVLIFTLPGIPLIYAGQEYGETVRPSLFEKTELKRNGAEDLYGFLKELGKIRRKNRALLEGKYIPVDNSSPDEIYSFMREIEGERVFVACNMGEDSLAVGFRTNGKPLNLAEIKILLSHGLNLPKNRDRIVFKPYSWIIAEI